MISMDSADPHHVRLLTNHWLDMLIWLNTLRAHLPIYRVHLGYMPVLLILGIFFF